MKKFFFTVVLSFFLFACNKVFKNREGVSTEDSVKREYVLGADKDENGCIASAGFTWSVLKNDCIRIFEVGYRLNSVKTSLEEEAVLSAFAIFNEDKNKVENFFTKCI
nr:hypothetical protein [uncultured Flavobacterium sp.]